MNPAATYYGDDVKGWGLPCYLVAGAGFEPATSGL
jgi:hypothetical protein